MDPDTALADLRDIVDEVHNGTVDSHTDAMISMAELFDGLDGWISKGGFLPSAWKRDG